MPAGSLYNIHYIIKTNVVRDYNYWARYEPARYIYIYVIIVQPEEIFVPELTGCVNNFIFSILKSHAKVSTEGIIRENATLIRSRAHTHAPKWRYIEQNIYLNA